MRGSQREYAKHRGVSHVAVGKAVKSGRISLDEDGKIDFAKADSQWSKSTDPVQQSRTSGGRVSSAATQKSDSVSATFTNQIKSQERAANYAAQPLSQSQGIDYNRARTVRETFTAKIEELKYKELSGQVVPIDPVRVGLFKVFTILKGSVMGIHSAARLHAEIPPATVELIDNLCRMALAEAHKSLQDLADGKI